MSPDELYNKLNRLLGGRLVLILAIFLVIVLLPIVIFSYSSNLNQISGRQIVQKVRSSLAFSNKIEANKSPIKSGQKVVLLWTQFFSQPWDDHFKRNHGPYVSLDSSDLRSCYFTIERNVLNKADAVIFHGRDFDFADLPKLRLPWQRWVYYLLESPHHSGFNPNQWTDMNRLGFNWSMTYSLSADVYAPYGVVKHQSPLNNDTEEGLTMGRKIANFTQSFWKRKRDAVWLVSNCGTPSRREIITKVLQDNGITVDSWGSCSGRRPDDDLKRMGPATFFSQYRFYLSFENSLCTDYVTEKGFQGLYYSFLGGSIPIVYGSANYAKLFPNGSYVNAQSFRNIVELARYMKTLSCPNSQTEVAGYYRWFKDVNPLYESDFDFDPVTGIFYHDYSKRVIWQNLCRRLWDEDTKSENGAKFTSIVPNMEQRIGSCSAPNLEFLKDPNNHAGTEPPRIFRVLGF